MGKINPRHMIILAVIAFLMATTLGVAVAAHGTIIPLFMDVGSDVAVDEDCLTFEATGDIFEWQTCGGGGGSAGYIPINEFVGTYSNVTTYAVREGVRALDGSDWKLYISLVDGNIGNDPVTDSGVNWLDVRDDAHPVIIEGTLNPNSFDEQSRITHYTHNATGGTFKLGDTSDIDWDASEATIQSALDAEYGLDKLIVIGDAADFTIQYYGDALVFDDTDLTGGGLTLQSDTQELVVGGFLAYKGSAYMQHNGDIPSIWHFNEDTLSWQDVITLTTTTSRDFDLDGQLILERGGNGDGDANLQMNAARIDNGNGSAEGGINVERSGAGEGDAFINNSATVASPAIGFARASANVEHYTGGVIEFGGLADDTGAYLRAGNPSTMGNGEKGFNINDLATNPNLATPEEIYRAFVDSGTFIEGSGGALRGAILRSSEGGQEFVPYDAIGVKVGRVYEYDFDIDGGAVGTIPLRSIDGLEELPEFFIAQNVQLDMITALSSGGVASGALTTGQGAGDLVVATLVAGTPWSTTGLKSTIVLIATVSTNIKMTDDREPALVVSGADLTGGRFRIMVEGWLSD